MYLVVVFVTVVVAVIFLPFFMQAFSQSDHIPAVIQYSLIGGAVLITGFSLLSMLKQDMITRRSFTVVTVDSQNCSIEEHRGKRILSTVAIPITDLLDIDYGLVEDRRKLTSSGNVLRIVLGSKGITVKARTGIYTFGAGQPDAEVEYLASVIEKALTATLVRPEQ